MGKQTGISWTDHTFNPWWGCVKVSPACDACYAETWAHRTGHEVWGKDAPRRFFGDRHWQEPLHWNEQAAKSGTRRKVFCASMADVFEERSDLSDSRERLWNVIEQTPNLDWLLLTKRPQNIDWMIPHTWRSTARRNAWFGVTAENEQQARKRLPWLRGLPNALAWVSYEPALGPVDWTPYLDFVKWIIFGGESGATPRKSEAQWARDTLAQCRAAGTAFFNKQAGSLLAREWGCENKEGKIPAEWPIEFQVQEFPSAA
jgi:protein gp37